MSGDRSTWTIDPTDVAERIRAVLAGAPFQIEGSMRDVEPVLITQDGWRVAFFSDAGALDYIERVETADGRRQEEWFTEGEGFYCPLNEVTQDEFNALDRLLQAAGH
jgi:hypothetical protein